MYIWLGQYICICVHINKIHLKVIMLLFLKEKREKETQLLYDYNKDSLY